MLTGIILTGNCGCCIVDNPFMHRQGNLYYTIYDLYAIKECIYVDIVL